MNSVFIIMKDTGESNCEQACYKVSKARDRALLEAHNLMTDLGGTWKSVEKSHFLYEWVDKTGVMRVWVEEKALV